MRIAFVAAPLAIALGLTSAFLSPVAGQDEPPIIRLPAIRVTPPDSTTAPQPSRAPNRIDTVTSPELEATRPSVSPEALDHLPGVTLQSEQGNRFQPNLGVRGSRFRRLRGWTFAPDGRAPGTPVRRFLTPAPPIGVLVGASYAF